MGTDDANDDGQDECPGHVFDLEQLMVVNNRVRMVKTCRSCGAPSID